MSSSRLFGRFGPRLSHMTRGKGGIPGEIEKLRRDTELAFLDLEASAGVTPLEQFIWYIDVVNGNDDNDGTTSATALKSFKELRQRWGYLTLVDDVDVKVYVMPGIYDEGIDLACRFTGEHACVQIIGVPEVIRTGTVTAFTLSYYGAAPGGIGTLTDATITNWMTPVRYYDYRLHFDPGGPLESYSFADQFDMGAHTSCAVFGAIQHRPPKQYGSNSFGAVYPIPAGTTYRIERLPVVRGVNLRAELLDALNSQGERYQDTFYVQGIAVDGTGTTPAPIVTVQWDGSPNQLAGAPPVFWGCSFNANIRGCACFYGCQFSRAGGISGGVSGYAGRFERGSFVLRACSGSVQFDNSYIENMRGPEGAGACQFNSLDFADSRTSGEGVSFGMSGSGSISVDSGSAVHLDSVWGQCLAGTNAFRVNGRVSYNPSSPLERLKGTGAANDMTIGGTGVDYSSLPYHDAVGGTGNETDAIVYKRGT